LTRSRNTTGAFLEWRVVPALLILALCTANATAFMATRHAQCLFDLSIEELMEIRIGAESRLGCWASLDDGLLEAERCAFQAESSQPQAAWPHMPCSDNAAKGNGPAVLWNR
jgi:hypothetical protein